MDLMKQATPADCREESRDTTRRLPFFGVFERPVDEGGLPLHVTARQETPVAAVFRVVAVVAHHEVVVGRDRHRTIVNADVEVLLGSITGRGKEEMDVRLV